MVLEWVYWFNQLIQSVHVCTDGRRQAVLHTSIFQAVEEKKPDDYLENNLISVQAVSLCVFLDWLVLLI